MEKRLYRDEQRKTIGGVCAGLADYFNVDVSIVRLVFVLAAILKGGGVLIYIVLWAVLPRKQAVIIPPFVDYTVPPEQPYQPFTVPPVAPVKNNGGKTARIMGGTVLILVGILFILDQFNIIPDWDFEHLWPLILVTVGLMLIFTGRKKQPWDNSDWNKTDDTDFTKTDTTGFGNPTNTTDPDQHNSTNTNPPTV